MITAISHSTKVPRGFLEEYANSVMEYVIKGMLLRACVPYKRLIRSGWSAVTVELNSPWLETELKLALERLEELGLEPTRVDLSLAHFRIGLQIDLDLARERLPREVALKLKEYLENRTMVEVIDEPLPQITRDQVLFRSERPARRLKEKEEGAISSGVRKIMRINQTRNQIDDALSKGGFKYYTLNPNNYLRRVWIMTPEDLDVAEKVFREAGLTFEIVRNSKSKNDPKRIVRFPWPDFIG